MRKLLLISILFGIIGYNSSKKKTAKPDKKLTILTYGLPNFDREQAEMVVATLYGFKFKAAAGCLVSDAIVDSIAVENYITEGILAQKYGKEWKLGFYAKVDSILQKENRFILKEQKGLKKD